MARRFLWTVAFSTVLVAASSTSWATAGCRAGGEPLLFSGQPGIIIDQFGLPDYGQDCVARAFDTTLPPATSETNNSMSGSFCAEANGGFQDPLRASVCDNGSASGDWQIMDGMVLINLNSAFGDVTVKMHGNPEPPDCPVEQGGLGGAAGVNGDLPIDLLSAVVCEDGEKIGSVKLCDNAGPAYVAEAENMSVVLKRAVPSSNMGINFLCQNARMRGESGAPIIVNLCFPLNPDGSADVGPEGEPAVRFPDRKSVV